MSSDRFARNVVLFDVAVWLVVFFALRQFAAVPGHPLYSAIGANVAVMVANLIGMSLWSFR